jgi:hypothetical protein
MNKIKFLTFAFFLTSINAFTQDLPAHKNQIEFSLTKMINPPDPGFELSYERKHGEMFSTQMSAAYLVDCFQATSYKDYSRYRILIEEKLYFFKKKIFRQYFSLETGYYAASMMSSECFVPNGIEKDDELYYESQYVDIFSLKRKGLIIDAKYGQQFLIKRFTIGFGIGIGILIHNVSHSNRLKPDDKMVSPGSLNVYHIMDKEGKRSVPYFPFTLKFGYAF